MAREVFIRAGKQVVSGEDIRGRSPLGPGATMKPSRGAGSEGFYRVNVSSTCIRWVGWEPDTGTLRLAFVNGGIYDYYGVHPNTVRGLSQAGSVGRAFWRLVRQRHQGFLVG